MHTALLEIRLIFLNLVNLSYIKSVRGESYLSLDVILLPHLPNFSDSVCCNFILVICVSMMLIILRLIFSTANIFPLVQIFVLFLSFFTATLQIAVYLLNWDS